MQYTPHNYQAYCIQRVVEDPAIGLFLRPGLGKTVITLSAVNILKYFRWQVAKALVVAPKKVAEATWARRRPSGTTSSISGCPPSWGAPASASRPSTLRRMSM